MELFRRHAVNWRLLGGILVIILTFNDSLILVLIVDEIEIVLACGIELYWSILAHFGNLSDELFFF